MNVPVPWGVGPIPAKYCNSAIVVFSPWDFTFELAQITAVIQGPQQPGVSPEVPIQAVKTVHDYIAMSPSHAKALLKALAENVATYEAQFGAIPDIELPQQAAQPTGGE